MKCDFCADIGCYEHTKSMPEFGGIPSEAGAYIEYQTGQHLISWARNGDRGLSRRTYRRGIGWNQFHLSLVQGSCHELDS
jgi:hypothetical protein